MSSKQKNCCCLVLSRFNTLISRREKKGYLYAAKFSCEGVAKIYGASARLLVVAEKDIPQVWLAYWDRVTGTHTPWVEASYMAVNYLFSAPKLGREVFKTLNKKYLEEVSRGQDVSSQQ